MTRKHVGRAVAALAAVCVLLVPLAVDAQTVLRSDDRVSVDTDQVVEGNFYTIGNTISVSGQVDGDWLGLGNSITGNGTFTEDVLLVGRNVQLHGSTTDDVRIVALEATIAEDIGGDVAIVANSVKILSSADISGDLLLFANEVEVSGSIGGDILGRANSLRVDGEVGGSLDLTVDQLTLGERADIGGNISYISNTELIRSQNATVSGDITQTTVEVDTSFQTTVERLLMPFLAIMFAGLVAFLLVPTGLIRAVSYTKRRLTLAMLVGFVVLLGGPLVVTVFLLSGLGLLVGLVLASAYVLLLAIGIVMAGPLLGSLLSQYVLNRPQIDIFTVIGGIVLLVASLLIPIFGLGLFIAAVCSAIGGMVLQLYKRRR